MCFNGRYQRVLLLFLELIYEINKNILGFGISGNPLFPDVVELFKILVVVCYYSVRISGTISC